MSVLPRPPSRSEPKYSVPSAATDGNDSFLSEFTLGPSFFGAVHASPLRSLTQRSASSPAVGGDLGRNDMKKSRLPSGETNGSRSRSPLAMPATAGDDHPSPLRSAVHDGHELKRVGDGPEDRLLL